jgi:hypothetical protein
MEIREIQCDNQIYIDLYNLNGDIFTSPEWIKLHKNIFLYGVFNKEKLVASFFVNITRKKGVSLYRNPPYTPHCGLLIVNNAKNNAKYLSNNKEIIEGIVDFFRSKNIPLLNISLPVGVNDGQPFLWKNYKVSLSYTYILKLNDSIETVIASFDSKLKSDISKATKDGLIVKRNFNNQIVKELVYKTFSRQKKIVNTTIDDILFNFSNNDNSFSFVTYYNNKPSAVAFCIYNQKCVYYLLGGYDSDNRHRGAGPLAVLSAIKYSKLLGIKVFDFEGSMIPNIEVYFRKYGGELVPKLDIHRAMLPLELLLKFKFRNIY